MARSYYAAQYSYRRPVVLIVGSLLFLATGAALTTFAASAIVKLPQGREIVTALFVGGIVGTLFFVGCYLLWAFIRRHHVLIEVDADGIQHGKNRVAWTKVRRIFAWYQHGRYQLKVVRRGVAPDLHLTTDEGLTQKEYERLLARLNADVKGRFPDLRIG